MWAGGHVVYGHCILIANLVLLQMKHNWTGYGATLILLQWLFYYFSLYLDTTMFDTNVIYAFYNQWCYNWYHWMGTFAVAVVVLVLEPAFVKLPDLMRRSLARCRKGDANGYTKIDPYGI